MAEKRESDGFAWQSFLIFAGSAYTPLMVWVDNPESPAFLSSAVVILVLTGLGLGLRALFVRLGADPLGISYSIALFLFFVLSTGVLVQEVAGGRWTAFALAFISAAIVYRLRAVGILKLLMAWGAFFLVASPILGYITRTDPGDATVTANTTVDVPSFEAGHDVVLIVLDGYASDEVLREFHGFDNSEFLTGLQKAGFAVGRDVTANFPVTTLSVVNTLHLGYVAEEQHLTSSDFEALYEMLGGNNTLAQILRENGYVQTYVESGSRHQLPVDGR